MRSTRVLVFARSPEPGCAKTRLIPALGAQGAADLYALLLEYTLALVAEANPPEVELWMDREPVARTIIEAAGRLGAAVRIQPEGDLGWRMRHALERTLAEGALPILLGSDVPALTVGHLGDANRRLEAGADAVLAPAEDGGYGLVAISRPLPEMFGDVPWGSSVVMAVTRQRLRAAGRRFEELDSVWDVDGPKDLARLDSIPALSDWRARIGVDAADVS